MSKEEDRIYEEESNLLMREFKQLKI